MEKSVINCIYSYKMKKLLELNTLNVGARINTGKVNSI